MRWGLGLVVGTADDESENLLKFISKEQLNK